MDDIAYNLYLDRLYSELQNLICEGYKDFISGMADGADLDVANAVIYYRDMGEDVTLEAALPYPIVPRKTPSTYTEERDDILRECDKKRIVSQHYHNGCMHKRNQYMVDKSDLVLAIWNGEFSGGTWNAIKYAKSRGNL